MTSEMNDNFTTIDTELKSVNDKVDNTKVIQDSVEPVASDYPDRLFYNKLTKKLYRSVVTSVINNGDGTTTNVYGWEEIDIMKRDKNDPDFSGYEVISDRFKVNIGGQSYLNIGGNPGGGYAAHFNNGDLIGINNLVMNDSADGEGIFWLKSGKSPNSINVADYDKQHVLDGVSYLNGVAILKTGDYGIGSNSVEFSNSDLNTITKTGFYSGYSMVNAPSGGGGGTVIHIEYRVTGYCVQYFHSVTGDMFYKRYKNNGTWSAWSEMISSTNIANYIQNGSVTITPSAANTPTSINVTFPKAYATAPIVMVTANTTVPGSTVTGVGVSGITTTGCTIWVTRTNTSATAVLWQASPAS
jgi:(2Fe-2S) ferredoxin